MTGNQKLNEYLKEIATLCRINKPMTSHIARHTFASTVAIQNSVPIETLPTKRNQTQLRIFHALYHRFS
jgi:site-specific recombinase XerD